MSVKKLLIIQSELTTLRTRYDQLLGELDQIIKSMSPSTGDQQKPKRQNKKQERIINFDAFYNKRKTS